MRINSLPGPLLFSPILPVAPIIARAPDSVQDDPLIVREGIATTITLTVFANPHPTYTWSRNGKQVTSGNGLTLALDSITFNPAMREHSGMYRLVATNSAGTGEFNFTLDVQCKIITFL